MKKLFLLLFVLAFLFMDLIVPYTYSSAAKKPKLNTTSVNMTINTDFTLRVYNLKKKCKLKVQSTSSNNVAVSNINQKKKTVQIHSENVGTSNIVITVKNGRKKIGRLECKVNVNPTPVSLKFMKRKVIINENEKKRLNLIVKPNTSKETPVFISSDPDIAYVNSRGVITGVSKGVVTITATLVSCNLTTTCTVTVIPADDSQIKKNAVSRLTFGDLTPKGNKNESLALTIKK